MMQNEDDNEANWESESNWRSIEPVGGNEFYEFITTQAIPSLERGLVDLDGMKKANEDRMRCWGEIAERAARLSECFESLVESANFMGMIRDFDKGASRLFGKGMFPSIEAWIMTGRSFTRVFRDLAQDVASIVEARMRIREERMPEFLKGIMPRIAVIGDIADRMHRVCRTVRKRVRREGSAFWTKMDGWSAMSQGF